MITRIITYGIIGMLIVGSLFLGGWAASGGNQDSSGGLVVGYLTQFVALIVVFLGIKGHRDNALGGVIKFFPALGIGLAISLIASLGWVIAWETVLATSHMDYGAVIRKMMIAQAEAGGATGAALEKATADAQNFANMYNIPPIRWAMTFVEMFPTGVLVSLISAGMLCNSRFLPPGRPAVQG